MSVQLKGRLIKKMPVVSGEGRNGKWEKMEFVIETEDQYPKKICMSLWGDKIQSLETFQEGDALIADVNIESREFNNRWYTDIRAWRLQRDEAGGNFAPLPSDDLSDFPQEETGEEGDLPF
ncbi:MAG: DUF3127 domain-containing protein [Bacteroidales bacterium]|nr:DUF3127 domain-containing protein [Bacteroidales bacterium]